MRSVILLDTKIDKDEALALLDEYGEFIEEHAGIQPEFWVERRDFSQVPTVVDVDGDMKPSSQYISTLVDDVHSRYGDDGTDNVVMWVHEDNFLYKGIWGQNWSYVFKTYSFQLCRWDKDNPANTFGTLFHEQMHSFDKLIKEETGFEIDTLFKGVKCFADWDTSWVHGNRNQVCKGDFEYIGRRTGKENAKALETIAIHLKDAYTIRKSRHFTPVRAAQWKLIEALSTFLAGFLKKK